MEPTHKLGSRLYKHAVAVLAWLCLLSLLCLPAVDAFPLRPEDLAELKGLWESTNGPNWNYASLNACLVDYGYKRLLGSTWDFTGPFADPCHFTGVQCTCLIDTESCEVLVIVVPCAAAGGHLPRDLGSTGLARLTQLDMDTHGLTGTIPTSLSNLLQLEYIDFDTNALTGTIPKELRAIRQLQYLDLSYNSLGGTLPKELSALRALKTFKINSNKLRGSIPHAYATLANLTTMSMQNNLFHGLSFGFIDPAVQTKLAILDISENAFTGSLSHKVFELPALQTFSAGSNCFSGAIPSNICDAGKLETLIITGLSSGVSCRNNIWAGTIFSEAFNGFAAKNFMQGELPQCMYQLQNLVILSASGNGLKGAIPKRISPTLKSIEISRNMLTGTISTSLASSFVSKRANLTSLDMSYNRVGGDLQAFEGDGTTVYKEEARLALTLKVNRLSGTVPTALLSIKNISILPGNLFDCNAAKSDLPQHDADLDTYQCGSTKMNNMLYIFGIFLSVMCIVGWLALREYGFLRYLSIFMQWMQTVSEAQEIEESCKTTHIKRYSEYLSQVRRFVLLIGAVILVVSIGYLVLSAKYDVAMRTVQNSYTWGITAAYLTGGSTAYFLSVGVIIVSIVWYCILGDMHRARLKAVSGARDRDRKGVEIRLSVHIHNAKLSLPDMGCCEMLFKCYLVPSLRMLVLICIIWGTMLAGNAYYLSVALHGTTEQQNYLNFGFSIIKLFWTMVFTPYIFGVQFLYFGVAEEVHTEFTRKIFGGTIPMLFVFNTVSSFVIPLLTVCVADPACFKSLFFMSNTKVVTYPVSECAVVYQNGDCELYGTFSEVIKMNVPYFYNYTCFSSMLRTYIPLYQQMYMLLIVRSVFNLGYLVWDVFQENRACREGEQLEAGKYRRVRYLLLMALPTRYLIYSNGPRRAMYEPGRIFPRYNKLWVPKSVVNLLWHVLMLLTMGVLVPPLGMMVVLTVVVETFVEQLVMGRFLVFELSVAHQSALAKSMAVGENYTGKLYVAQDRLAIRKQAVLDAEEPWGAVAVLKEVEAQCHQIPASALALGRAAFFLVPACMYGFVLNDVQNSSRDTVDEDMSATLIMLAFPVVIEGSRLLYKQLIWRQAGRALAAMETERARARNEALASEMQKEEEEASTSGKGGSGKETVTRTQNNPMTEDILKHSISHDVL